MIRGKPSLPFKVDIPRLKGTEWYVTLTGVERGEYAKFDSGLTDSRLYLRVNHKTNLLALAVIGLYRVKVCPSEN